MEVLPEMQLVGLLHDIKSAVLYMAHRVGLAQPQAGEAMSKTWTLAVPEEISRIGTTSDAKFHPRKVVEYQVLPTSQDEIKGGKFLGSIVSIDTIDPRTIRRSQANAWLLGS